MLTKVCSKCGEEKGVGEFHKRALSKDGLRAKCKDCRNKQNKEQLIDDSEFRTKINKRQIKQYNKNRDNRLKKVKERYDDPELKEKILINNRKSKLKRRKLLTNSYILNEVLRIKKSDIPIVKAVLKEKYNMTLEQYINLKRGAILDYRRKKNGERYRDKK